MFEDMGRRESPGGEGASGAGGYQTPSTDLKKVTEEGGGERKEGRDGMEVKGKCKL